MTGVQGKGRPYQPKNQKTSWYSVASISSVSDTAVRCSGVWNLDNYCTFYIFFQSLYLPLMYVSKCREHLLIDSEYVLEAFCSLLRRDVKEAYKAKGNNLVSVLVPNLLLSAFRNEKTWPEIFVRVRHS